MKNVKLDLIFVRHCESLGNVGLPYPGFHEDDPPLSENGLLQAEKLAKRFSVGELDAIYSGTLIRTCQTAEPTAEKLSLPILLMPELMEFGTRIPGTDPDKIRELAPAAAADAEKVLSERRAFSLAGETPDDAVRRADFAIGYFLKTFQNGERILIATHGTYFGYLIRRCLGLHLPESFCWQVDNCAVTAIRFPYEGIPKVLCANDVRHLYLQ